MTVRQESKAATRRRLLAAALRTLDEEGDAALTTTKVARLAGVSQPSFYVHFANMDELMRTLVDEELSALAIATTEAGEAVARDAPDRERFRDTFRIPMRAAIDNPELFRLMIRHRYDLHSPLGTWSQEMYAAARISLIADLNASGFPAGNERQRRQVEMIADGVIALTTELIRGHLDGRYTDIEETIDVLIAFSKGYLSLLPRMESVQ